MKSIGERHDTVISVAKSDHHLNREDVEMTPSCLYSCFKCQPKFNLTADYCWFNASFDNVLVLT
jgi:hypothetical protein